MTFLPRLLAAGIGLALLPTAASAGPRTQWLNGREARQEQRIDQGIASGSLTGAEATRLQNRETRLDNRTDKALSDGHLSSGEFVRLNRAYDRESGLIYRQKHDGQTQ